MNRIYRLVWSRSRATWCVASELTSRVGKSGRRGAGASRPLKLALSLLALSIGLAASGLTGAAETKEGLVEGNAGLYVNDSGSNQGCNYMHDTGKDGYMGWKYDGNNANCLSSDKSTQTGRVLFYGTGTQKDGTNSLTLGNELFVNGGRIGLNNKIDGSNSMAIGNVNDANGTSASGADAIAIGNNAVTTEQNAMALGTGAKANTLGGVALGAGSIASTTANQAGYVPIGVTQAQADAINATTSTQGAVAVGDASTGVYRQITGVAAGSADSDAVNVAQLKGVTGQIAQDALLWDETLGAFSASHGGSQRNKITNVAPGNVSNTSTDAVNGSQLYQTNQNVTHVDNRVSNVFGDDSTTNIQQNGRGIRYVRTNDNGLPVTDAYAKGQGSTAVGYGATADAESGLAVGRGATSQSRQATAIGAGAKVGDSSSQGLAVGNDAQVQGARGIAIGNGAQTLSNDALTLGNGATVSHGATDSLALGNNSQVAENASNATALGYSASAQASRSTALGESSVAGARGSVALGSTANVEAGAENGLALGTAATVDAADSIALGSSASVVNSASGEISTGSLALGHKSGVVGANSVALGASSNATNSNATALGTGTLAAADGSAALGRGATVNQGADNSLALGSGSQVAAGAKSAAALGNGAKANANNSLALGTSAVTGATNSVALGSAAVVGTNSSNGLALGSGSRIGINASNTVALGTGTIVGDRASNSMAMGNGSIVSADVSNGIALGTGSSVTKSNSVAIGREASATSSDAVALGREASAAASESIALGRDANTQAGASGSMALGRGASAQTNRSVALGADSVANRTATQLALSGYVPAGATSVAASTATGEVSIGSSGSERRLTNLAAGAADTDGVNVSQLKALGDQVADGDAGAVKYERDPVTGTINYNKVVMQGDTYNAVTKTGGTKITNVARGSDDSDAVNMSQLNETNENVTNVDNRVTHVDNRVSNVFGDDSEANVATNGRGIRYVRTNDQGLPVEDAYAKGQGSTAVGYQAGATGDSALALGRNASASADNSVALGANSTTTAKLANPAFVPNGAVVSGLLPAGEVSVGSAGAERRVTNVAAGADETDAVNVSQLKGVADRTDQLAQDALLWDPDANNQEGAFSANRAGRGPSKITNVAAGDINSTSTDAVNGSQLYEVTTQINNITLGGIKYFHANSQKADSVASGADSIAVGPAAQASGTSSLAMGDGANASASNASAIGSNAAASGEGATAVGTGSSATGSSSVAMGDGAAATGERSSAIGAGASAEAANSVALGADSVADRDNSVSVGSAGNERQITNVKAGEADTDAVNVSQLRDHGDTINSTINNVDNRVTQAKTDITQLQNGTDGMFQVNNSSNLPKPRPTGTDAVAGGAGAEASGSNSAAIGTRARASGANATALGNGSSAQAQNSVALGANSVADRANSVSVGSAGNERQITNVAAGTAPTDAVNVSQLQQSMGDISNQFYDYTDSRYNALRHDLKKQDDILSAGIAGAMAMATLPQPHSAGASMATVGLGNYRGQGALAVGVSRISDNGKWVTKLQGSTSSQGDAGVAVGLGYQW
ncbi:YadA-like family protein [Pseudomonas nitroreducens]|uniref:YadA-like family protein n=1 Tax=Pseudomonas nitroreducens TaxID=46680 RepID=UPI00209CA9D9|nr:YadA-like family protein [Pseudomonas nitroreducens]MCP1625327.1 autotransporter adhesin [Pseudomonas nitroreducens]